MKKFFKFGCLGAIILIVLIIIIAVFAGGDDEEVSTGNNSESNESNEEQKSDDNNDSQEDNTKKVDASDKSTETAGMKVSLGDVVISPDKLKVGINIENTTDEQLTFYPDQGSAVIGDMQLDANLFLTDGTIGGDVQGGVKQDGVLEFLPPDGEEIDVESVEKIKLLFGDVTTEDFMTSEAVEFEVPVK